MNYAEDVHKNMCGSTVICPVLTKTEMCCQILVKHLNIKFHENLLRNFLIVACIQMDKQAQ
jgi:hypothetical protein